MQNHRSNYSFAHCSYGISQEASEIWEDKKETSNKLSMKAGGEKEG
jgi:hypothetical protein